MKKLENEHGVKRQQLDGVARHPQFSALLQRCVLNAAETDEQTKHKLLERLVANRMLSPPETTLALASQLASDAITRSTQRQLTLMALQAFVEGVRPKHPMKFTVFKTWLKVHLTAPFEDFEFHEIDARHLVAIACATFDPTSQRMLASMLAMKGQGKILRKIIEILADTKLQMQWDHGLAGVELTSVGLIVGALAYDQLTGRDLGPPKWDWRFIPPKG